VKQIEMEPACRQGPKDRNHPHLHLFAPREEPPLLRHRTFARDDPYTMTFRKAEVILSLSLYISEWR
jgi:hypothetical protein